MRNPLCALVVLGLVVRAGAAGAAGDQPASYGETPAELVPFRRGAEPAARFFVDPPQFRGPGREEATPEVDVVRIGVLVPLEGPDRRDGESLLRGVTLAVEEVNERGGVAGRPLELVVRDEARAWGAAGEATVELRYDEAVWALIGGVSDAASHVMSRVLLKVELPAVNTSGTDPTLTEHMVPWLIRIRPDARRTGYRLAKRVFVDDGHRKVVVYRANDRVARVGVAEFVDAARRLGHPVPLEVRFDQGEENDQARIDRIRRLGPDAIVIWGGAERAGRVIRELRAEGIRTPLYGPDRLFDQRFLDGAGAAGDGTVIACPWNPDRKDSPWLDFTRRFRRRWDREVDPAAAWSYDGAHYLFQAVEKVGLNRVKIRDELFLPARWVGVTGEVMFDSTRNNVAPLGVCRVEGSSFRWLGPP